MHCVKSWHTIRVVITHSEPTNALIDEQTFTQNAITVFGPVGAPALVFGHGYGTDQTTWRHIADHFTHTHRVVLFDYVGSGNSEVSAYDPQKYDSLHGHASDLISVIEAVGVSDVVFVGHSVSGMIGGLAAIERPELFRKIVMLGPSPRYVNDGEYLGGFSHEDVLGLLDAIEANQTEWAAHLAPVVTARPDRPDVVETVRKHFAHTPQFVAKHFARVVFLSDVRHRLHEIPVPCVVLQSQGDIICPPHIGEYLTARIPTSQLIELKTSGHFVHLTEPALITGIVAEAL